MSGDKIPRAELLTFGPEALPEWRTGDDVAIIAISFVLAFLYRDRRTKGKKKVLESA